MIVKKNEYTVLTGPWPDKTPVEDFFCAAGIHIKSSGAVRLVQTYSDCRLEIFDPVKTSIDLQMLEQYRAFCPEWELWIRSINGSEFLFRFIGPVLLPENIEKIKTSGFGAVEDRTEEIIGLSIETVTYPLWGKRLEKAGPKGCLGHLLPLTFENRNGQSDKGCRSRTIGWYTREIPRVIQYPADIHWDKVALAVDVFIGISGDAGLVRYRQLVQDTGRV